MICPSRKDLSGVCGIPTILGLRPRAHLKKIWEAFIFIGLHLGAENLNDKSQFVMLVPSPPVAMLRLPVSIGNNFTIIYPKINTAPVERL